MGHRIFLNNKQALKTNFKELKLLLRTDGDLIINGMQESRVLDDGEGRAW